MFRLATSEGIEDKCKHEINLEMDFAYQVIVCMCLQFLDRTCEMRWCGIQVSSPSTFCLFIILLIQLLQV